MAYILDTVSIDEDEQVVRERFRSYYAYLESVRDELPTNAYEFAVAEWHYDAGDPRCLHDAWVESVTIYEISQQDLPQERSIEILVKLVNAELSGSIILTYRAVHSYTLHKSSFQDDFSRMLVNQGHNDLVIDEISLSENKHVLHEVRFWLGSHWLIECEDIEYQWLPLGSHLRSDTDSVTLKPQVEREDNPNS